jgi:hypothetical protein
MGSINYLNLAPRQSRATSTRRKRLSARATIILAEGSKPTSVADHDAAGAVLLIVPDRRDRGAQRG